MQLRAMVSATRCLRSDARRGGQPCNDTPRGLRSDVVRGRAHAHRRERVRTHDSLPALLHGHECEKCLRNSIVCAPLPHLMPSVIDSETSAATTVATTITPRTRTWPTARTSTLPSTSQTSLPWPPRRGPWWRTLERGRPLRAGGATPPLGSRHLTPYGSGRSSGRGCRGTIWPTRTA